MTITARIRPSGIVTLPIPRRQPSPDGPPCRCCVQPLETAWQPHWRAGEPGYRILTCRNLACGLSRQTFSEPDYDTVDLSRYGAQEHADYRRLKAAYDR